LTEKIYNKSFPSNPELLPDIEDYIMGIVSTVDMSEENLNKLALSVAEAASNAIIHGNKADNKKLLKLTIKINADRIQLIFKDEGKGFNPAEVPNPTTPENILKTHGRGLHIMNTFLDDLTYNFLPDGTETILTISLKKSYL